MADLQFLSKGHSMLNERLDHATKVMGYHPKYRDIFLKFENFILRSDGPLPFDYRHYIAIMAAGRHQCGYLINLQKQEFLQQGGNKEWLKGLSYIPKKLRNLYEINKILAHRPWLINESHIKKLTKGSDCWSLSEAVQGIVLLAHFHSLCSFVFACGVNQQLDQLPESIEANRCAKKRVRNSNTSYLMESQSDNELEITESKENGNTELLDECEVGLDILMERMRNLTDQSTSETEEERVKSFEHSVFESQTIKPSSSKFFKITRNVTQFVEDANYRYDDPANKSKSELSVFIVQDYSWDDHGFPLVNRLYNDVGNLLDDKFKITYNLTYYTMGGRKGVDTSRFRRAIWNYIQCVFGIRHDDYNYQEIAQLLSKSLKAFIKVSCCYPEHITKQDYDSVLKQLHHSEKVHVNLMILEARMQAELLYGLRAVMPLMT